MHFLAIIEALIQTIANFLTIHNVVFLMITQSAWIHPLANWHGLHLFSPFMPFLLSQCFSIANQTSPAKKPSLSPTQGLGKLGQHLRCPSGPILSIVLTSGTVNTGRTSEWINQASKWTGEQGNRLHASSFLDFASISSMGSIKEKYYHPFLTLRLLLKSYLS